MLELIRQYEMSKKATSKAEALMMNDFNNEELEAAFDLAYETEYRLFEQVVAEIQKATGIKENIVRMMVNDKLEDIKKIIA